MTAMLIVLTLSAAWMAAYSVGAFSIAEEPDCISFVGGFPALNELSDILESSGKKVCPPEGETIDQGLNWNNVRGAATISSMLLILLTSLGLMRDLFMVRKFKGYLTDHEAFLAKYNRL